jgi:hypothetical protein
MVRFLVSGTQSVVNAAPTRHTDPYSQKVPLAPKIICNCKVTVKSFSIFPSPAGMSQLSMGGNYDVIFKLFLPRESLVSDIPTGEGNIEKLFS